MSKIIIGISLFLISLWGGAYLQPFENHDVWWAFPSYATSAIGMMAGIWCFFEGLIKVKGRP